MQTVESRPIAELVREVVNSLEGDLTPRDLKLFEEVSKLADFIDNARREIAEVDPTAIAHTQIPAANDELDAIVTATEEATGTILDSAEQIENVAARLTPEERAELETAVTRIYEACNFQDITGQRIGKVVKTLKQIEAKVDAMVAAFAEDHRREQIERKPEFEDGDERALLNGPSLPDTANSQEDIDALLASFD